MDRFLTLVRRELGADDVRVLEGDAEEGAGAGEIVSRLRDGRTIAVRFASPPPDLDARQRRLEILLSTFDVVVDDVAPPPRRLRPDIEHALRDELGALSTRAVAVNALVIDANSPVVWGAAEPQGVIPIGPRSSRPSIAGDIELEAEPAPEPVAAVTSRRALHLVRSLPELAALRKGRHVRHVERNGETPLIAHSFAGIYLLVVVFAAAFDELRAERAILEALPRVERLVLALPPLDPSPHAGVLALKRPRRR